MSSKPKKAAPEKAASKATPKAAPSTPPETRAPAAAVGGADRARLNRLSRAGFEGADRCALLGVELDVGPRATPWQAPHLLPGVGVVCTLGVYVVASGVNPSALELAAARLRKADGDVL